MDKTGIYCALKEFKQSVKIPAKPLYVCLPSSTLEGIPPMNIMCHRPKFYFVKVDVRACFDTIKQDKLLEIVEGLLKDVCRYS